MFLAAPFMFLTLLLLCVMRRGIKQTGKQPRSLISGLAAILLCLLLVLVFVVGLYYPIVIQLFWNVNALATVVLAHFVTMRSEETAGLRDSVPVV